MSGTALPPGPGTEIDRLRSIVSARFPVYETRVLPHSLVLLVHADPTTLEARFDSLRRELWERFYVPQIRHEGGEYIVEVVRRPTRTPWSSTTNLILLGVTIATTIAAGAFLWLAWRGGTTLRTADILWGGFFFAFPLLGVLGIHELAHYVVARRHHVEASLPYFIPVPPPFLLFGTFGAFISLREPIPSKKALLDIGASGPLAGFAVAIPVTLAGMVLSAHSTPLSAATCGPTILGVNYGNLQFGGSLFWNALGLFVPAQAFQNLHPLALAGWVGLLVTAINLLPAGQLDGGHVFRALLGERSRWVSYAAVALLFGLSYFYSGWIIFALLILVLGVKHPPPLNDLSRLDVKRWVVGALAVGILVSGFVIVPIAPPGGQFDVSHGPVTVVPNPPAGYALAANVSLTVANHDAAARGYTVSSDVTSVYENVNGTPVALQGASLARFEANSSWVLQLPNGSVLKFSGTGAFSVPPSSFFEVAARSSASFSVVYLNHDSGVVTFTVVINELCVPGHGSSAAPTFTIP